MGFQICDASCGVPDDDTVYPTYQDAVNAALESAGVMICEAESEGDDE